MIIEKDYNEWKDSNKKVAIIERDCNEKISMIKNLVVI